MGQDPTCSIHTHAIILQAFNPRKTTTPVTVVAALQDLCYDPIG